MAIVIDTNILAKLFDCENIDHPNFAPVLLWIDRRKGFLLFGGTIYLEELKKAGRYLKLINQLRTAGKAFRINCEAVDHLHSQVLPRTAGTKCNDSHIIALLAASKCSLLCTEDAASIKFMKDKSLYPKGMIRVKIYSSIRNSKLLKLSDIEAVSNIVK